MRVLSGLVFVLVALLPYAAMLVGGDTREPPPPADAEILTVISPHRREVKLEYSRGFREWMHDRHGRDVGLRGQDVGGTSKILKDLASRFAEDPDAVGVDIMFGGGVDPFLQAADQGWLSLFIEFLSLSGQN